MVTRSNQINQLISRIKKYGPGLKCIKYILEIFIYNSYFQATRPADNPVGAMARKLHLGGHMARNAPRLSLPGKLVFPSTHNSGHFSMLGLGDIVMPGLLLCFVMRYDAYKRAQVNISSYFHLSLPFPHLTFLNLSLIFQKPLLSSTFPESLS